MDSETFIRNNLWWIVLVSLVILVLKGRALWEAANNKDKAWFIAILILNTLGILELFYLLVFSRRQDKKETDSQE